MVDLGKWFSEEHLIPSPIREKDRDDPPDGAAEPGTEDEDSL